MAEKNNFEALMAGNKAYVSKARKAALAKLAKGQSPSAIILGCADSRVPVEKVFGIGEPGKLIVVRAEGNVASDASVLGSVDYGVHHLHVPLIVVLGHTQCGAVKAAMAGGEHGPLGALLSHIEPACEKAGGDLDQAIELNVKLQITNLMHLSEIVKSAHDQGKLEIVGAVYSLDTGKVRRVY